ncbi:YgjV family protein [Dokdonia sp.]|uniref:YgjV family protein n=1 Tax=Dokdonia sp. TaxID=2024995 RepID=UPI0032669B23
MEFNSVEIVGYLASLFVLLSFFRKDIRQLRITNSIGCAFFVAYGVLLTSIPIIITNVAILLVNGYYLFIKKSDATVVKPEDN